MVFEFWETRKDRKGVCRTRSAMALCSGVKRKEKKNKKVTLHLNQVGDHCTKKKVDLPVRVQWTLCIIGSHVFEPSQPF